MVAKIHNVMSWDMTPCTLAGGYKCFRGMYCLQLQTEITCNLSMVTVYSSKTLLTTRAGIGGRCR
jgi:hypothetical protein